MTVLLRATALMEYNLHLLCRPEPLPYGSINLTGYISRA